MSATLTPATLRLGPDANGVLLTPEEFDSAEFEEGWIYELIQGVLVVSPTPLRQERDPNEELGYLLRRYQDDHPQGSSLDATLPEEIIRTPASRRRADRVIWAGLGRLPEEGEPPTIAVELVSEGRRNFQRDYEAKRDEYRAVNVQEYWVIDRFSRTMAVFFPRKKGKAARRILGEDEVYTTPLLPGFELPLARLFELADRWGGPGK